MRLEITGCYFPACMIRKIQILNLIKQPWLCNILSPIVFLLTYDQQLPAVMCVHLLALGCAWVKRLQHRYHLTNLVQYAIFSTVKVFPLKCIFGCSHCPIHPENGMAFHRLVTRFYTPFMERTQYAFTKKYRLLWFHRLWNHNKSWMASTVALSL